MAFKNISETTIRKGFNLIKNTRKANYCALITQSLLGDSTNNFVI